MRFLILFLLLYTTVSANETLVYRHTEAQPLPAGIPDIDDPDIATQLHDFNLEEMKSSLHRLINEFRQDNGKPPLATDPAIHFYSQRQSDWMAVGRYPLGHQNAKVRFQAIQEYIPQATKSAENCGRVGVNHADPIAAIFSGWIMGPRHRAAILGDFDLCGYGISKTSSGSFYFSHFFVKLDREIPCEEDLSSPQE
jgi:uncharacterized protein YkwD